MISADTRSAGGVCRYDEPVLRSLPIMRTRHEHVLFVFLFFFWWLSVYHFSSNSLPLPTKTSASKTTCTFSIAFQSQFCFFRVLCTYVTNDTNMLRCGRCPESCNVTSSYVDGLLQSGLIGSYYSQLGSHNIIAIHHGSDAADPSTSRATLLRGGGLVPGGVALPSATQVRRLRDGNIHV